MADEIGRTAAAAAAAERTKKAENAMLKLRHQRAIGLGASDPRPNPIESHQIGWAAAAAAVADLLA